MPVIALELFMEVRHNFTTLPKRVHNEARNQLDQAKRSIELRNQKIKHLDVGGRLSPESIMFLKTVQGLPLTGQGFPLSSDQIRYASAIAMIEEAYFYACRNDDARYGPTRLRLLTCSPSVGICEIANSTYPVVRTKLATNRLIRKAPISGLMMLDFGLFNPEALQAENQLVIHAHGIVQVEQPGRIKVQSLVRRMSPANANNALGAPVTSLKVRDSGLNAKLKDEDIFGLGRYITKVSCGTNTKFLSKGRMRSQSNLRDWTSIGALKQLEIESYVDALLACWSIGEVGSQLRKEWRKRFFGLLGDGQQPRNSRIKVCGRWEGWRRVWDELDCNVGPANPKSILCLNNSTTT